MLPLFASAVAGGRLESRRRWARSAQRSKSTSRRERAFEAIADLARRPAFTDHFLTGFHLTRIESAGVGAGARFRRRPAAGARSGWTPRSTSWTPPTGSSSTAAAGRANRIPATTVWELLEGPGSLTRIRVSHWTEPANHVDRALEALSGTARWQERGWREALRRLRDLLESDAAAAGARSRRPAATARDRHPLIHLRQ